MTNVQSQRNMWQRFYAELFQKGGARAWPSETLIRLVKGPYIEPGGLNLSGLNVCDVGFGAGESFPFLHAEGARLYGTEISEGICTHVQQWLKGIGVSADLRVGHNRALPFPDEFADVLISWNVIHYEDNQQDMAAAIEEYARILRRGGRVLLSTTGPEHKILRGATKIGHNRFRIEREDDPRKGEVFYYFETPQDILEHFSGPFENIQIGRTHDQLFDETLDWYIVTATRSGD